MSIEIKKIYLENYKLFTIKEIDFSNCLCVFDGPNGYGKTSIFDAIEFLITGSISRIQESEVVAANISYSKNCLANDPEKDIRIKAEFKDNLTDKSIVIALCIPASVGAGKQNNPKSIETQTQSYILPAYDIPNELSMEYGFDKVFKECFSNKTYMDSITVEKLKAKEHYIEEQYYSSFDQVRQKLDVMKQQEEKLASLVVEMKAYHKALKKAIELYQQLVIKQIEIPFFLYCSRLLQSYQGGQGVLIDSKDSKIRFTAPGGEHDILYTMSSGQLSAVLLAFSLVLNKIYSGKKFKTLFIDDPIQCMDDINMISFVELLRREFSESQIILSTHEDSFANYIKYKFSKYNIRSQSVTLKNDK